MAPSSKEIRLKKKILLYLNQIPEDFHPTYLRQIAESPEYQRVVKYCSPDHLATAESARNQRSSEEGASRDCEFLCSAEDRRLNPWDEQKEMDDVFETAKQLEFAFVKEALLDFMSFRLAAPRSKMELPATWKISDPNLLYKAFADDQYERSRGQRP
ncbi:hypothetical protein OEA41_006309 [Lepraria neglecta]|uniref:Uncharacterized protein n=1 Tax=Lepraria neglecta TaxID=209136 RepID=A0AAD9Z7L3_9LECA|nr:hypothetical protein OEA41_006309 [Lepraria neglecta]